MAADQYVRDYSRIYRIPTVVFRQSCIYGYRQFGIEDQGWVAWFIIAVQKGRPITIYGNGKQVRDVLFIDDPIEAFLAALRQTGRTAGQVYNIGGGAENPGDLQRLAAGRSAGFHLRHRQSPARFRVGAEGGARTGIRRLYEWVAENPDLFQHL